MTEAEAWVMIPKLDKKKEGCVIDMRPLVLCKDCIWRRENGRCYNDNVRFGEYRKDNWFCAYGESSSSPSIVTNWMLLPEPLRKN